jgi:hypothetical protein
VLCSLGVLVDENGEMDERAKHIQGEDAAQAGGNDVDVEEEVVTIDSPLDGRTTPERTANDERALCGADTCTAAVGDAVVAQDGGARRSGGEKGGETHVTERALHRARRGEMCAT